MLRYTLVHRAPGMPWQPVVTSVHIEGNTATELAAMAEVGLADYVDTDYYGSDLSGHVAMHLSAMCSVVAMLIDAYACADEAATSWPTPRVDLGLVEFAVSIQGADPD
jgi:hypothetical protein